MIIVCRLCAFCRHYAQFADIVDSLHTCSPVYSVRVPGGVKSSYNEAGGRAEGAHSCHFRTHLLLGYQGQTACARPVLISVSETVRQAVNTPHSTTHPQANGINEKIPAHPPHPCKTMRTIASLWMHTLPPPQYIDPYIPTGRGCLPKGSCIHRNYHKGGMFARCTPSACPARYLCIKYLISSPKFILTLGSPPSRPH